MSLCPISPSDLHFTEERRGELAILRMPRAPLHFTSDLGNRDDMLSSLDRCDRDPSVRAIILLGCPDKHSGEQYDEFMRGADVPGGRHLLQRMLNVFNQFVLQLLSCSKPLVFADGGRLIAQYINVALACDYRIAANDTVIRKAYLSHGLVPKGGGVLFLSQMLSRSQVLRLLLSKEDVSAEQALELGLVDGVVPRGELERAAIEAAEMLSSAPPSTVAGIKRLLRFTLGDVEEFLELENREISIAARQRQSSGGGRGRGR